MITTYESFKELAVAMTEGGGILHAGNCPSAEGCIDWQRGIEDFAEWLDHIGVKVAIPDSSEDFYEFMSTKAAAEEGRGDG